MEVSWLNGLGVDFRVLERCAGPDVREMCMCAAPPRQMNRNEEASAEVLAVVTSQTWNVLHSEIALRWSACVCAVSWQTHVQDANKEPVPVGDASNRLLRRAVMTLLPSKSRDRWIGR